VGIAGPWDLRRIVGTVPVEEDGSASWKAPANVPLAIQALDAEGKPWRSCVHGTPQCPASESPAWDATNNNRTLFPDLWTE